MLDGEQIDAFKDVFGVDQSNGKGSTKIVNFPISGAQYPHEGRSPARTIIKWLQRQTQN